MSYIEIVYTYSDLGWKRIRLYNRAKLHSPMNALEEEKKMKISENTNLRDEEKDWIARKFRSLV